MPAKIIEALEAEECLLSSGAITDALGTPEAVCVAFHAAGLRLNQALADLCVACSREDGSERDAAMARALAHHEVQARVRTRLFEVWMTQEQDEQALAQEFARDARMLAAVREIREMQVELLGLHRLYGEFGVVLDQAETALLGAQRGLAALLDSLRPRH